MQTIFTSAKDYASNFREVEDVMFHYIQLQAGHFPTDLYVENYEHIQLTDDNVQKAIARISDEILGSPRRHMALHDLFGVEFVNSMIGDLNRLWEKNLEALRVRALTQHPVQSVKPDPDAPKPPSPSPQVLERFQSAHVTLTQKLDTLKTAKSNNNINTQVVTDVLTAITNLIDIDNSEHHLDDLYLKNLQSIQSELNYFLTADEVSTIMELAGTALDHGKSGSAHSLLEQHQQQIDAFFTDPRSDAETKETIAGLKDTANVMGAGEVEDFFSLIAALPRNIGRWSGFTPIASNLLSRAERVLDYQVGKNSIFHDVFRGVVRIVPEAVEGITSTPILVLTVAHTLKDFGTGATYNPGKNFFARMLKQMVNAFKTKPLENVIVLIGTIYVSPKIIDPVSGGLRYLGELPAIHPHVEWARIVWNTAKLKIEIPTIKFFAWRTDSVIKDVGVSALTAKTLTMGKKTFFYELTELSQTDPKMFMSKYLEAFRKLSPNQKGAYPLSEQLEHLVTKYSQPNPIAAIENLSHLDSKELSALVRDSRGHIYGSAVMHQLSLVLDCRLPHDLDIFLPGDEIKTFTNKMLKLDPTLYVDRRGAIRKLSTDEIVVDIHHARGESLGDLTKANLREWILTKINDAFPWTKLVLKGDATPVLRVLSRFEGTVPPPSEQLSLMTKFNIAIQIDASYFALMRKVSAVVEDITNPKRGYRLEKDIAHFESLLESYKMELEIGRSLGKKIENLETRFATVANLENNMYNMIASHLTDAGKTELDNLIKSKSGGGDVNAPLYNIYQIQSRAASRFGWLPYPFLSNIPLKSSGTLPSSLNLQLNSVPWGFAVSPAHQMGFSIMPPNPIDPIWSKMSPNPPPGFHITPIIDPWDKKVPPTTPRESPMEPSIPPTRAGNPYMGFQFNPVQKKSALQKHQAHNRWLIIVWKIS